jgi:hypothetical protein
MPAKRQVLTNAPHPPCHFATTVVIGHLLVTINKMNNLQWKSAQIPVSKMTLFGLFFEQF